MFECHYELDRVLAPEDTEERTWALFQDEVLALGYAAEHELSRLLPRALPFPSRTLREPRPRRRGGQLISSSLVKSVDVLF